MIRDMLHSCSHDKVASAAVACIGGAFEDRARAARCCVALMSAGLSEVLCAGMREALLSSKWRGCGASLQALINQFFAGCATLSNKRCDALRRSRGPSGLREWRNVAVTRLGVWLQGWVARGDEEE